MTSPLSNESLQEATVDQLLVWLTLPAIVDDMNAVELMSWRQKILALILQKSCPKAMKQLDKYQQDRIINTSMAMSIARRGVIPTEQPAQALSEGNSLIRL